MDRFQSMARNDQRFEEFYKSIQDDIGIILIASRKVYLNDSIITPIIHACIEQAWNRYKKGGDPSRIRERLYTRVVQRVISRYINEMIAAKEARNNEEKP
jgi:hypothetical protein